MAPIFRENLPNSAHPNFCLKIPVILAKFFAKSKLCCIINNMKEKLINERGQITDPELAHDIANATNSFESENHYNAWQLDELEALDLPNRGKDELMKAGGLVGDKDTLTRDMERKDELIWNNSQNIERITNAIVKAYGKKQKINAKLKKKIGR